MPFGRHPLKMVCLPVPPLRHARSVPRAVRAIRRRWIDLYFGFSEPVAGAGAFAPFAGALEGAAVPVSPPAGAAAGAAFGAADPGAAGASAGRGVLSRTEIG